MNVRFAAALLIFVPLAACGGGGGISGTASTPKISATPQASVSPGTNGSQSVSGSVSITIPSSMKTSSTKTGSMKATGSHVRRPQFVSPSTESVSITVNGGTAVSADVSATSSYCTPSGSSRTCTIPVAAPAGATTIALSLLDANDTMLGSGTGSTTATLGQAFALTITINPVAGSIASPTISYSPGTSLAIGTSGTASFTTTYADPDGNAIPTSATFSTPLSLSTTDANVTVSPTSVTSASQAITLSYNGSTAVAGSITLFLTTGSGTNLTTVGTVTLEPGYAPPVTVSTFAGTGAVGFTNGSGTSAMFDGPDGLAVDGTGNVYVADFYNNAIRKITAAGVVSTVAGTGSAGFTNGPAASAAFDQPQGVTLDGAGDVYVADTGNNAIRKITAAGIASTLAGIGTSGFTNGPGTTAAFFYPVDVAVDNAGNVYVADDGNNVVREITAAGVVSTFAGTGTPGFANGADVNATFNGPTDVALDTAGDLYVVDYNNNAIRKIAAGGVVSTVAGTGAAGFTNGPAATATFDSPVYLARDGFGNIYVSDKSNFAIREISANGTVSTLAGTGVAGFTNGAGASAAFGELGGIAVDTAGNVYVADFANDVIRKITP